MPRKRSEQESQSTEEKIKAAASVVFTRKGYAATRTRDIAEEAGINLALLNYYFRSKEKLFSLIMSERMSRFFGVVLQVADDKSLTLEAKVTAVVTNYDQLLTDNPDLPIFVLSEIRTNPAQFAARLPLPLVMKSDFIKQIRKRRPDLHPVQFLLNLLGLTIFPFLVKPVLQQSGLLNERSFRTEMGIRKELIPKWINAFLKA